MAERHRQPLASVGSANSGAWSAAAPFGSPAKLELSEQTEDSISPDSVAKNAARVIEALEAESPPEHSPNSRSGGPHQWAEQHSHNALAVVPAGSSPQQAVDPLLSRRFAPDSGAGGDVVAVWEQAEALRQQLRHKDADLQAALEALAVAQACAASPGSLAQHHESGGQQLARFLKDQLAMRDEELATAQDATARLRQQLERRDEQLAAGEQGLQLTQAALTDAQAEVAVLRNQKAVLQQELAAAKARVEEEAEAANYARLEAEEVRREAAAQVQQLRSELWATEARANLAAYGTPGDSGWQGQEGSISVQQPGTAYHSAGDDDTAVDGPAAAVPAGEGGEAADGGYDGNEGEVEDVFSSPMMSHLRAASSPKQPQQAHSPAHVHANAADNAAGGAAQGSSGFQFVSSLAPRGSSGAAAAVPDDGTSSGGESEVTVSEAAVVARTLTRASALQKDREQLRQQVSDLSFELRDLKGKQKQVAQHMQAAHGGGAGHAVQGTAGSARDRTQQPLQQQEQGRRRAAAPRSVAGGDGTLAEQCRLALVEERHLRSEVEMLNRKCEKGNEMLLKANHAMKILHYKLQKERKAVGRLQDEKCTLQAQLLSGAAGGGGSDPRQLATLLQELQACRSRIEGLLEEKASLAAKLESVATGGRGSSREQREAAAATLAVLQQQQEAAAAALREELGAERARAAAAQEERAVLEGRLLEVMGRLSAAEQISGHLDQMNAYLQEERQRCQQLASLLGREQQGSESQAAEVGRLSALAHQSIDDVMAAREAAQQERSRAEQLLREKALLAGKVEALQETLQGLEKSDDVLLRLTEDKAELQGQLRDSQAAAERAAATAEARARQAAELEATCQDLRGQLDSAVAQHDVAHTAVEGAADQLQSLTASHETLERQLAATAADLDAAQAEAAQRAQQARHLEQQAAATEAELRQALQQRDAALSQLQDLHRQLGAAQQEAAAQHQVAVDRQARLEAAAAEQEGLVAQLRGLEARNSNLTQNLKALEAECEAVQRLGSSVDQTNQTLVDNMCDMSGLVDAVQALQQRNRLLQQDLDTLKGRYAELHSKHEVQAGLLHTAEEQLAAEAQQHSALQTVHGVLQEEASSLRRQLSVAQAQRDQAAQQHKAAEQELGGLMERCSVAEASLADSRQRAEEAVEQHKQAASSITDLQQQLGEARKQAAAGAEEAQELGKQRDEMQEQLAAMKKAQSVSEGKLVLARQREAHFKEASKQLKVLQGELKSFVAESQLHRQRRDAAEQRCEELETRCLDLEQRVQQAGEQLATAEQEREQASARQAALQEQLTASHLSMARLEAQQEAFQSVQQRVNELESEQHTAAEWFDALTAELTEKTDQLAALELKLAATAQQQAETTLQQAAAAAQLAGTQQQVEELLAGKEQAEAAHGELSCTLELAQRQLAEAQELLFQRQQELDGAEGVAAEVSVQLVMMQASREAAEAALAEAQNAACTAQHTCGELHQHLAATQASYAATQKEQLHRIEQLNHGLFVMAAVHVSAVRRVHAAAATASQHHDAAMAAAQEQLEAALAAAVQEHAAAASEAEQQRQQQVASLDGCVADLTARLEIADAAHQAAVGQCSELQAALAEKAELALDLQRQLAEASTQRGDAAAAQEAAERRYQHAAADGEAHQRHAQLADEQCSVLREQLSFLQDQLQSDSDAADSLKAAVAAAKADSSSLQHQLAAAKQAVAGAADEQRRLQDALESAGEAQQAAQQREAELRLELAVSAAAAQHAEQAAERALQEAARGLEQESLAGRQADQLRQQLEVEEERRRALEQRMDAAWAEREQLLAKAQIHDALESLSSRLESQLGLLQQTALAAPAGPTAADTWATDGGAMQTLPLRQEQLSQVLDKLQSMTQQLWCLLEDRLSSGSSSARSGGAGEGAGYERSRPNRYVAQLEAERTQLTTQLSAARQEQGEAASRLTAAQTAISTLQIAVQRLAAAGGGTADVLADVALLGPASPEPSGGLWSITGAVPRQQQQPSNGGAASQHSGMHSGGGWRQEKRLLKSICRLALAVTMDHIEGRQEAAVLAAELDPLMDGQAATLHSLGLHKVWASLRTLALFGGSSGRSERQQPAVESEHALLPREVWALQQRLVQCRARCKELKATVVAAEGAAARWQAQAGDVEQCLTLLRFRLTDLLGEVHWALGDYSGAAGAGGHDAAAWPESPGGGQLAKLVEQLGSGLRRLMRKYATLSGHLFQQSDDAAPQPYVQQQYMHDFMQDSGALGSRPGSPTARDFHERRRCAADGHSAEWQEASSADGLGGDGGAAASQAGSWAIGAGRQRRGGSSVSAGDPSSGYGGTASEAMAEAGRKAASIAAKLDGLLTPQSRAAVHGGGRPGGAWKSRFAPEGAAGVAGWDLHDVGEESAGCSDLQAAFASPRQQQLWQVPAGDPEEVPLHAASTPF